MGSKHNKKRFFCVKYTMKADKKFDELVTPVSYTHLTLPTNREV